LQEEKRRGGARHDGLDVVDEEWGVQRELILAAETFKEHVVDSVSRADHGFWIERVCQTDSRCKIALVDLHQSALLQRAVRGKN
jgi:hypothetical protein